MIIAYVAPGVSPSLGAMFEPSAHYVTCNLLDPDPDLAARALGFPFRDITGRARFAHAIRALNEDARP